MSYVYPSSYTSADAAALATYDAETLQSVLETNTLGTLGVAVTEADLIFAILEKTNDLSWLDPDLIDLDTSDINALQHFTDDNRGTQAALDIEAFLEGENIPTDDLNDAGRIIADNADILDQDDATDDLMNVAEFFKKVNPAIYILLRIMFVVGPMAQEGTDILLDDNEEELEQWDDNNKDMEGLDGTEDHGELSRLQQDNTMISQRITIRNDIIEMINELINNEEDAASSLGSNNNSTSRNIVSNF